MGIAAFLTSIAVIEDQWLYATIGIGSSFGWILLQYYIEIRRHHRYDYCKQAKIKEDGIHASRNKWSGTWPWEYFEHYYIDDKFIFIFDPKSTIPLYWEKTDLTEKQVKLVEANLKLKKIYPR